MQFRRDIQGLRAIAVLLVMLFHFNPAWLPGGFVGVDVFLVISGYLIVSILLEKKSKPAYRLSNTLRYFYLSRVKRIAPAYFAMLIVVSLLAAVLFLPSDLAIYKQGLKQAALFNSNNYFSGFGDYFAPHNHEQPLLHTWSLAVEIQFYLLAPLLVLLLPSKLLKWLFAALLICLTAVAEYRLRILGIEQATYYSLYARLPEFLAGGLLAMYLHRNRGGSNLVRQFGCSLDNGFGHYTTPVRTLSWGASAATGRRGVAGFVATSTRTCRSASGQQTHDLAGRVILLALPVALASSGFATLLHRFAGTGHVV